MAEKRAERPPGAFLPARAPKKTNVLDGLGGVGEPQQSATARGGRSPARRRVTVRLILIPTAVGPEDPLRCDRDIPR